ncbi:MAG: DUF1569 domain-containing protein [Pirellulales bacterium]
MATTTKVQGRRRLRFNSHDDVLAEVRALAARPTRHLGHWPLPTICQHLANAMNLCIDGDVPFKAPLKTRILARLARSRILKTGLPTGFKLPAEAEAVLYNDPGSADAAIAAMEQAVARLQTTQQRVPHPALGKMNVHQWNLFHLRHAELHLSFIVPA